MTVPPDYATYPDRRYPVIYLMDGNVAVPQIALYQLLTLDPIYPIRPFIHVGVGYVGEEAHYPLAFRARDLLPPGEHIPTGISEASMQRLVELGILDAVGVKLYLHHLHHPAGDQFYAFLSEELHPRLVETYRIETHTAGLFGYSYGGLFATYVALQRSPLFHRIGVGSPGISSQKSKIFELYQAELNNATDHTNRWFHLTVCQSELTNCSYYYPLVGQGTAALLQLLRQSPLRGLAFSSQIIEQESHATGFMPSWFSFLRTCYAAS
ncbi:MAG: alpha/beta hydrolase-fold protein [Merismopediaceae bacterium]|nr:alpha/beta hydrolase-fold protein [Merismopediaceae bacterium]